MKSGDLVIARDRVIGILGQILRTGITAMHEIFDERAYERYLSRTGSRRSVTSYREFMREKDAALVRRPRCC